MPSSLILASASPRRAELLANAGYEFDVRVADVDEAVHPGEAPEDYVLRVARDKARVIAAREGGGASLVIGADTTVVAAGQVLGKPRGPADAVRMLTLLSGTDHDVLTGVVIVGRGREEAEVAHTRVHFVPLTDEDIAWYVSSGEPDGKAGAYAIQGRAARFIDRIEGSWSNVVGLPVATIARMIMSLRVVS
jgi:septum formation protein